MNKAKLSSFAIAGVIGFASLSPITTVAAIVARRKSKFMEKAIA